MPRKELHELTQLTESDDTLMWAIERKSTRATRRENARKYRREED
jgi:hypothetical protein